MNRKNIPDWIKYNFCNLKKVYYKNSFIRQDIKSMYFIMRKRIQKKKLLGLVVIPTTFCNANCTFCANRHLKSPRKNMPFRIFKKAIDECSSLNIKEVDITPTIGEVFIDKDIFKKIDYIYKKGLDCSFYTNGFLIGQNIEKILKSPLKKIKIDIADIIPKNESKVFQVPEELCQKKIKAILELIERNKTKEIQLSFRPMREFNKIIRDMKKTPFWNLYKKGRFWMDYNTAYDNWGGSITKKDLIGFQVMKRAPKIRKFPCRNLSVVSVLPDGKVRLCGCRILNTFDDELVLGDISQNSIKKLFESEKYEQIIKDFKNKKIPKVCQKCTFYIPHE